MRQKNGAGHSFDCRTSWDPNGPSMSIIFTDTKVSVCPAFSKVPYYMFGEVWAKWPLANSVHPGWREAFRFFDTLGDLAGAQWIVTDGGGVAS